MNYHIAICLDHYAIIFRNKITLILSSYHRSHLVTRYTVASNFSVNTSCLNPSNSLIIINLLQN